jgi:outer membrane lipoprotein SlyB
MKKNIVLASALIFCFLLTGCAQNLSPNSYNTNQVNKVSQVEKGTVVAKRMINIDNNSGAGGMIGSGMGAAAGSLVGRNTATSIVGALGGALIGGLVGNSIDKGIHHQKGFEYTVKLKTGKLVSVVQTKENEFYVNQKVLVSMGPSARITPDSTAG